MIGRVGWRRTRETSREEAEKLLVEAHKNGETIKSVSEKCDITTNTLSKYARELGLIFVGGTTGKHLSLETRKKISESNKGKHKHLDVDVNERSIVEKSDQVTVLKDGFRFSYNLLENVDLPNVKFAPYVNEEKRIMGFKLGKKGYRIFTSTPRYQILRSPRLLELLNPRRGGHYRAFWDGDMIIVDFSKEMGPRLYARKKITEEMIQALREASKNGGTIKSVAERFNMKYHSLAQRAWKLGLKFRKTKTSETVFNEETLKVEENIINDYMSDKNQSWKQLAKKHGVTATQVKTIIGMHLMRACRIEEDCPYKPLLPEYREV